MHWLANMRMRQKLLLLLSLPFFVLFCFSIDYAGHNYAQLNQMSHEKFLASLADKLNQLKHALSTAKDVGLTYAFSKGTEKKEEFRDDLQKLLLATANLKEVVKDENDNTRLKTSLNQLFFKLDSLERQEQQFETGIPTPDDVISFFAGLNQSYFQILQQLANESKDVEISRTLLALIFLSEEIEGINSEEIVIQQALEKGSLSPGIFETFLTSIASQEAFHRAFSQRATHEQKETYRSIVNGEALSNISKLRNQIKKQNSEDKFTLDLALWKQSQEAKKLLIYKVNNELIQEIQERADNLNLQSKQSLIIVLTTILLITICSILLTVAIFNSITIPLHNAVRLAKNVGQGNLQETIAPSKRKDEMGDLERALATMVEGLKNMARKIQEEVQILASSTQKISSAITEISTGTTETAAAVTEATTTIEELRQTGQVSSEKAKDVQASAEDSLRTLQQNEQLLNTTIEEMQKIESRMSTITDSITKLSENSHVIGKIIDTVNDLSEQSNLLAVNAAIEAAKAGDQGKGFSVVASEVRRLAEQSKQATLQVHSILNDIQNATSSAVLATEQGSKAVTRGVDQSLQTTEAIRFLSTGVIRVNQAATQITTSSQQQLAGVGQVTIAMSNIKETINQHVSHMHQIVTVAENLNRVGQTLKELVDQYKL